MSHEIDGYIFDEGIHVLHTSNKYVLNLMEIINAKMDVRNRDAWIFSHGAMTRYPFQANTYGLPANIIKDCLFLRQYSSSDLTCLLSSVFNKLFSDIFATKIIDLEVSRENDLIFSI